MQSYNNLETLRRTYLAPLLCLAILLHILYHFHFQFKSSTAAQSTGMPSPIHSITTVYQPYPLQ